MDPNEVLELIRSAPKHYQTVRAALAYRGGGPTIKAVRKRYWRSETYRRERKASSGQYLADSPEPPDSDEEHAEPDGPFGWRCRVWYDVGGGVPRSRRELELPTNVSPGGVDIFAWDGRMVGPSGTDTVVERRIGGGPPDQDPRWLWMARDDSYWTTYPFDPDGIAGLPSLLEDLDLKVEGRVSQAGRQAVRLVGTPIEEWEYDPEPLWWGADEYELLVDAERGVILRLASRLGGKDFDALEVEEVHFDERFPEGVFSSREPLPWR